MTLLADVVTASRHVAETGGRSRKVTILAELLGRLEPGEVATVAGFLSGVPRQGRVGIGYSTVYGVDSGAAVEASLTVADLDEAITEVQEAAGSGSKAMRRELLADLLGRATEHEADFLGRLFTGELRQGALTGLMVDAVAEAAAVPAELVRRALMLSGALPRTAEVAMGSGERGLRAVGFELFRPVLPMLASTAETVANAVARFERASVEWKLDGIRVQIHRRATTVRIYTRNVKPVRTYDLVVLGAEWGHGRREGWLSNLHLGARDAETGGFVMVGKCFKGLTDELLAWQTEKLLARETARRGIAGFVRPELVVEIALDGVQSSTRYPGGLALRFARVKRYRPDKEVREADTIDDLRALLTRPA